jgi:predicted DNA-binding transcriptional regulator AlpA
MHNDLNTPGRRSTAAPRPAPGKRAGRHARRSTDCAWHPSRNPARRPALRSVPLLSAVSLHPFLAAGVKRNSVRWAPDQSAEIPLTFLQAIITSGSVRYLFGFDEYAAWCRYREKVSGRQMRRALRRTNLTSASTPYRSEFLGVSESHFYNLHRTGRLGPSPVRMGRSVRWSRTELVEWFEAGSPPRNRWRAMRAANN